MSVPPPPRPSALASVSERPTEGPLRPRKRSTFVVRYDAILTVIVALAVGICIGMAIQFQITLAADPWHGVPWCTDAMIEHTIATGEQYICHGDPAANPNLPDQD